MTARPRFGRWRSALRRDALPLLALVLGALLMMRPVLADPAGTVLGVPGDNLLYLYATGQVAAGLAGPTPLFFDPQVNYPDGMTLLVNEQPYLAQLLLAPVTVLAGPVLAYNLILLLGSLLSGYVLYRWLLALTGSRLAGVFGGLAFVLLPMRLIRLSGHLNLATTVGLPLFFWMLDRALMAERPSWRQLLPLGLAAFVVGSASQYYLAMALLLGLAYGLLSRGGRPGWLLRRGPLLAGAAGLGGGLAALPYLLSARFYQPYLLADIRAWSADPRAFVLPWPLHPLWGSQVARLGPALPVGETSVYVGLVALALALVALVWPGLAGRRGRVWLGCALLAVVLALGTDLHLGGQPLRAQDPLWLPAVYLMRLPGLGALRVWPRIGLFVGMFVALLAGLAVARLSRGRAWAGLALLGLLGLDQLPPALPTIRPQPWLIAGWLERQPAPAPVAYLPPPAPGQDARNHQQLYSSLFHPQPLIAFVHAHHLSPAYRDFQARAAGFPAPAAVARLRALGLRFVLLEPVAFDGVHAVPWAEVEARIAENRDLRLVERVGSLVVVELPAAGAP